MSHGTSAPPADRAPTRVRLWVQQRVRNGRHHGPAVEFGSAEWCALDDRDPRKIAAVCVAAFCWWEDKQPERIRQRVEDELTVERQLQARAFAAVAADVRDRAGSPSWQMVRSRWAS